MLSDYISLLVAANLQIPSCPQSRRLRELLISARDSYAICIKKIKLDDSCPGAGISTVNT